MARTTVRSAVVFVAVGLAAVGCTTKKLDTADTSSSTSTASTSTTAAHSGSTGTGSTGSTGTTATTSESSDAVVAPDSAWDLDATSYRGQNGLHVSVECPADGTPYIVWGTDTYTDDSSICTAAVHAGLITLTGGGKVVIVIGGEQASFTGSEAYGVTTSDYGAWGGSYTFAS